MNRIFLFFFAICLVACTKNPITGRSQLVLFSEAEIQSMASTQYQQFLSQNKVVTAIGSKDAEMVRRVGTRISTAISSFYTQKGLQGELAGYKWEYNLVDSKEANAWCMPGGKIVVYTGLLPITQNEAALAVVIGHEVAHALARHGNERMSQAMIQELGGVALSVAMSSKPAETQAIFMGAYGLGTTYGAVLPFSRSNELEADKFGLYYCAMAGYNPQEAIPLWERMAAASAGKAPPEFASTHPAESTRIEKLKQLMPEALKYYKPIGVK
ncbi:M48 family metallopeptidase [Flavihumibacter profundi]|jgi:predicted Zn-dependent protease|uniref:M48 family metallopeptidase n=1 Tax=Flavihumibacter profundi TaxID=2716883 RepID=UPI001CC338B0|nr:M48 family metallopeptidase [Flavihumibacter profundi]MBZ5856293.1 M48 family metallopeptidase [Flavihumibacter profundi]